MEPTPDATNGHMIPDPQGSITWNPWIESLIPCAVRLRLRLRLQGWGELETRSTSIILGCQEQTCARFYIEQGCNEVRFSPPPSPHGPITTGTPTSKACTSCRIRAGVVHLLHCAAVAGPAPNPLGHCNQHSLQSKHYCRVWILIQSGRCCQNYCSCSTIKTDSFRKFRSFSIRPTIRIHATIVDSESRASRITRTAPQPDWSHFVYWSSRKHGV